MENIIDPFTCENIARGILESLGKIYIFKAKNTIDYDLITEKGRRIEVKATHNRKRFDKNSFTYHTSYQRKMDVFSILVDGEKLKEGEVIIKWKYIKKFAENIKLKEKYLDLLMLEDKMKFEELKKNGNN